MTGLVQRQFAVFVPQHRAHFIGPIIVITLGTKSDKSLILITKSHLMQSHLHISHIQSPALVTKGSKCKKDIRKDP